MGDVHRGYDELLQRPVAIKLLARALVPNETMLSRFHREAMASARLAHPNVVTTLDFGVDDGQPFMVMELVEGIPLDRFMDQVGVVRMSRALSLAADVARGLDAAHQQEVVHRDIKPANVMVAEIGGRTVARIMDFGVAQFSAAGPRLTMAGGAVGTPGFVAPEQLAGHEVGPAADIFSLGVTLFQMLSARLPWDGEDAITLLTASLHDAPVQLSALDPTLPHALTELVMQMLDPDPNVRPSSAAEIAERLDRIASSERNYPDGPVAEPMPLEASVVVVASMDTEPQTAQTQLAWLHQVVADEGGSIAHSIRREVVALLPSAEAAMRLTRTQPATDVARPGLGLHVGPTALDEAGVALGPAVRTALRLARLSTSEQVLLTEALHDAIGLGWRGRVRPRGEMLLGQGERHRVFAVHAEAAGQEMPALIEAHADGLHWRCPCSAHGPVPAQTTPQMRLRCSRCSQLLSIDFRQSTPSTQIAGNADDHPLSSIVLTAPVEPTDDDEQIDRGLIAAISGLGQS